MTVLDLNESVTKDGKKAEDEFTDEWRERHNYRGVYDAVWDPSSSILTCSVENTLQVWDMSKYECLAIHGPSVLKEDRSKQCSCFHVVAASTVLVFGMTSGHIRTVDLISGDTIEEVRHSKDYICDIKGEGEVLVAIDCYGNLQEWRVDKENRGRLIFLRCFKPDFPSLLGPDEEADAMERYSRRGYERLLDFNEEWVASTVGGYVYIWHFAASPVPGRIGTVMTHLNGGSFGDVLCLSFDADGRLIFSVIGGRIYAKHPDTIMAMAPEGSMIPTMGVTESYETFHTGNVTSISVSKDHVVTGDVNGEIYSLRRKVLGYVDANKVGCGGVQFSIPADSPFAEKYDFVKGPIETAHEPEAIIWCIHTDETRFFSGDSDGKLVVHDFWDYKKGEKENEKEKEEEEEEEEVGVPAEEVDEPAQKKLKSSA